jgi:hypothetical protein
MDLKIYRKSIAYPMDAQQDGELEGSRGRFWGNCK